VVICCHNSAKILPETLACLVNQRINGNIVYEVIVVDNASTDGSALVAEQVWPKDHHISLRVVNEPRLGLSYARHCGVSASEHEIISFIDDDNWVYPDWVQLVAQVMTQHPEVGACGGCNEAVCETSPPGWFERYQLCYAVGAQFEEAGDITQTRGYLWGAGLSIRKAAWKKLVDNGFHSLLVDRQGASLSAGGDAELCYALRLAGWRLWYEPRLRLRHFITERRLRWEYLRMLNRGFGEASVGTDPYEIALREDRSGAKERLRRTWSWRTLATLKCLVRQPIKLLLSFRHPLENDPDVLVLEGHLGRLTELFRMRRVYGRNVREVRQAQWRQKGDLARL
jgi:glycosyltransferase involved in cell wall biosynthesis